MGLTVTEDTPADMLAGNMELLVQLPPRIDEDYDNDDIYEGDDDGHHHQHHRNNHRHHNNHHHNNGHHPRRTVNGNARRVTVARSTPMMDLLVQVATSQKLSASSYTLEAIGEHGLVLTHHPNTPIGALDALQVKLLPKQGTFVPMKTRRVNQPFEQTFRLQVHLPRNQLYVSRVSSRMNLGKILDDVCREKNLDRNNYELCHPANIEETLDLSLSLQDYHLQEVTLCPKRRSMGSSLSSQDIMALQRQEERRRQEAKQSVFGFAFKKSKESSLSTDSLGERSVSPARSDGTGRSASPQAPTAPTRPQRKRRPAPKPPMPKADPEQNLNSNANGAKETERITERERENPDRMIVISHSRNSSDSSGYHEASVLSDNLDSNIRAPETLPRRTRLQVTQQESPGRTLAESAHASKSLGNLAAVPAQRATIARGISNSSLSSAGLRKKKAAPAPPPPRPLSSAISTQGLERIVDSEESLSSISESLTGKASSDVAVASERKLIIPRTGLTNGSNEGSAGVIQKIEIPVEKEIERRESPKYSPRPEVTPELEVPSMDPSISSPEIPEADIVPNVETARERKRAPGVNAPIPKPRLTVGRLENAALYDPKPPKTQTMTPIASRDLVHQSMSNVEHLESILTLGGSEKNFDDEFSPIADEEHRRYSQKSYDSDAERPRPMPRGANNLENDHSVASNSNNSSSLKTSIGNAVVAEDGVVQGVPILAKNLRAISSRDNTEFEIINRDMKKIPKKPRRKMEFENPEITGSAETVKEYQEINVKHGNKEERKNVEPIDIAADKLAANSVKRIAKSTEQQAKKQSEEILPGNVIKVAEKIKTMQKIDRDKRLVDDKKVPQPRKVAPVAPAAPIRRKEEDVHSVRQESSITSNVLINDKNRSCAVISTIPKCDHFQSPIDTRTIVAVGENDRTKTGDSVLEYKSITKIDSSIGSSFGAGKSILESNCQWDGESIATSSMTTDVTNSETEDELELESFEMFEGPRNQPKLSTLLRSHSELNNFEINTFEGNGRHLTSRSEDFTFALNPNLARNISDVSTDAYPDKNLKRHLSLDDNPAAGKSSNKRTGPTKIPAFLATTITWEKQELLHGAQDHPASKTDWTVGNSGSGEEAATFSTELVTKSEETCTSDLLKKVSDTLSGSLRSPTVADADANADADAVAVAATPSLPNEQQSNAHCVDERRPGNQPQLRVNEAQHPIEVNENNLRNTIYCKDEKKNNKKNERGSVEPIDTNFHDNSLQPPAIKNLEYLTTSDPIQNTISEDLHSSSSTANDWQYVLPEPPTAFRDSNVVEDRKILISDSKSKTFPKTESIGKLNDKFVKSSNEIIDGVLTNGTPSNIRSSESGSLRSRTTSASSSDVGINDHATIDRKRLSRMGVKSSVDLDLRRGSQALSTPTVAPVDNTLSNFVITTYSRPKNVDIFNEIEQKVQEPQQINRKNSYPYSGHNENIPESGNTSTAISLHKHAAAQSRNYTEENISAVDQQVKKSAQSELPMKNHDLHNSSSEKSQTLDSNADYLYSNTVNRSNIKISIATKPRPRGDSINDQNRRQKPVFVNISSDIDISNSKLEDVKLDEDSERESAPGNNKKFSQWREDILNKQETPTTEKQLQSLQVLRSILPQLDDTRRNSDEINVTEKSSSNTSEETRVSPAVLPNNTITPTDPSLQQTSNEMPTKRYSYAGPPAINLGSWSDRSRTTKVQIKPDNDYKVEKSRTLESGSNETSSLKTVGQHTGVSKTSVTSTLVKNSQAISTRLKNEPAVDQGNKKEPNELAKTLIVRTTASGFKRPVSMIVGSSGTLTRSKNEKEDVSQKITINGEKETQRNQINIFAKKEETEEVDEVDSRPRNFKELKETFAKDQNTNTTLSMPKYGTYGRRSDNSTAKSTIRRDSFASNGETQVENLRTNKPAVPVQDNQRNFVIPQPNNRNGVQDAVRKTSRGILMPVVKGFKVAVVTEDEATPLKEKRSGYCSRVAIGDISNGNYIPNQNGLRKTTQVNNKVEEFTNTIPKPPPTMPVITGVTLKSTNRSNARPKSMPVEPDTRNQLLESIRNFGGQNQLRRIPRRNTNINGGVPGSRMVRS